MFEWLKNINSASGVRDMIQLFRQMLEDGRHVFDAAANALLAGTDPNVIKEDLWSTDKRINHNERKIRRMVVTHGSVHGARDLPVCLVLMSLVKDAERIGDYGKNILDLAMLEAEIDAGERDQLLELKVTISKLLARSSNIYESQDEASAQRFIADAEAVGDLCDARVSALVKREDGGGGVAAAALVYRYFKRVAAHSLNIVTSVVVPLDKLDYYDESKETRD